MPRLSPRIALLTALCAACALPVASVRADGSGGPSGQFQPTRGDRDGDGVRDPSDCAPDDPSRPARSGTDANCDGVADPVQHAASRPSSAAPSPAVTARRAAGVAVVAVHGLRLGSTVAVFAPRRARPAAPELVFAARENCAVTVTPTLVFAGARERALAARHRSVPRAHATVVRLRLTSSDRAARRVRLRIAVTDLSGTVRHAMVSLPVA